MVQEVSAESLLRSAIQAAVQKCYDIDVALQRLPGENMNFLASVSAGCKFVIKVAGDDQNEDFIEMEYLALKHASERLPGFSFPLIVENKFANIETFFITGDNCHKRLRIIKYLNGECLDKVDISDALLRNVGECLAGFDQAMQEFDHPAAHRNHRWNLMQLDQHRRSIELLQDEGKRQLLSWAFEQYQKIDSGISNQLKRQFIHGDANPENLLVQNGRVVGLLDFGDSCRNPRICELAICLPYLMMDQADPPAIAGQVISGYESVVPLSGLERRCLAPLVIGRLANTLCVATQRRQIEPHHPNWFVSEERAWHLLDGLRRLPEFSF